MDYNPEDQKPGFCFHFVQICGSGKVLSLGRLGPMLAKWRSQTEQKNTPTVIYGLCVLAILLKDVKDR